MVAEKSSYSTLLISSAKKKTRLYLCFTINCKKKKKARRKKQLIDSIPFFFLSLYNFLMFLNFLEFSYYNLDFFKSTEFGLKLRISSTMPTSGMFLTPGTFST